MGRGVRMGRAHATQSGPTALPGPHSGNHGRACPLVYRVCLPTPAHCPWDAHSADTRASAQRPSPAHCPVTSLIPLSSCQDLCLCLYFRIHFPKQGKAADKSCPCR